MKRALLATTLASLVGCGGDSLPSPQTAATPVVTTATPVAAATPPPALPFRDVTTARGIDFSHDHGGTGRHYLAEIVGAGGGFLDYDQDGDLDLYLVDGAPLGTPPDGTRETAPRGAASRNRLYANDGHGRFTDVTRLAKVGDTGYGMGLATGDIDNDGDTDLYVTNLGSNVLYVNQGNGTFSDQTTALGVDDQRWSTAAVWFDYDRDSDLDLFVANYVDFTVEGHRPCVVRGHDTYCPPTQYAGTTDRLFRNDLVPSGTLAFTDVTEAAGMATRTGNGLGAVAGDIDLDGDLDLYVANDRTANFLYVNRHGDGDGKALFSEAATLLGCAYGEEALAEAGMGTDFGDIDGDGDLDLVVTNMEVETNSLYVNELGIAMIESSYALGLGKASLPFVGFGVRLFDYDLDGDLDMFVANGHIMDNVDKIRQGITFEEDDQLFRNDGTGHFTEIWSAAGAGQTIPPRVGRGLATGDFDDDGDLDVLITNNRATPYLLENTAGDGRPAVGIVLEGAPTKSNRDGAGARVSVVSGAPRQVREVRTDGSYLAANDPRLLLAATDANGPVGIEIRWPSGATERHTLIPGDYHHILEGRGVVRSVAFKNR